MGSIDLIQDAAPVSFHSFIACPAGIFGFTDSGEAYAFNPRSGAWRFVCEGPRRER